MENSTLQLLLQRRTIRAFKAQTLTAEQVQTLMEVAQHTATSNFWQQSSVIHVTDPQIRAHIREPMGTYLFLSLIFIAISKSAKKKVWMMEFFIIQISSYKQ